MSKKNFIDFGYLKKILHLLGDGKKQIPKLISFVLFISLLDLAGIGLIAPYLSVILDSETFYLNYSNSKYLPFELSSPNEFIILLGIFLIFIFIVKAIGGIFLNKLILEFCFTQGVKLRSFLMLSYQNLPYEDFLERNSSEYIYNMQVLAEQYYKQILQSILRIGSEGIVMFLIALLLIWTNIYAFILLFILLGGSLIIYDIGFRSKLNVFGEKSNIHSVEISRGIREGMTGIKEIRVLGKESFFHTLVKNGAKNYKTVNVKSQVIASAPRYFLELVIITFIVLATIVSIALDANMNSLIPTLGMFGVASIRMLPSINQIIGGIVQVRYGKNTIDILYKDAVSFKENESDQQNDLSQSLKFSSLELKKIDYSYRNTKKNTLNKISLLINKGESIGIIGKSGTGKTTLIDIMLGILKPKNGDIFLNQNKLIQGDTSLIKKVAYIPQQVLIIDDSLATNIALMKNFDEINLNKLNKSIEKARLSSLVDELPQGIKTKLGDGGLRISGGQRQRVALARAFYHDRDILIMDESTSSLDKETESEIVDEIKNLKGKITMIIISHNIATIKHCDKVYRIENGSLIETN